MINKNVGLSYLYVCLCTAAGLTFSYAHQINYKFNLYTYYRNYFYNLNYIIQARDKSDRETILKKLLRRRKHSVYNEDAFLQGLVAVLATIDF